MKIIRASWRTFAFVAIASLMALFLVAVLLLRVSRIVGKELNVAISKKISQIGCFAVCAVCGIQIRNRKKIAEELNSLERCLVVANHISYIDIVVIGSLTPALFVCKAEVKKWPLIGWLARLVGAIFVDRQDMHSRLLTLFSLKDSLKKGTTILFPEGTTTSNTVPLFASWQRGNAWAAVEAKVPVFALGLHYIDQKAIAWIDEDEFTPHLWAFFQRPRTEVSISGSLLSTTRIAPRHLSEASHHSVREQCLRLAGREC